MKHSYIAFCKLPSCGGRRSRRGTAQGTAKAICDAYLFIPREQVRHSVCGSSRLMKLATVQYVQGTFYRAERSCYLKKTRSSLRNAMIVDNPPAQ